MITRIKSPLIHRFEPLCSMLQLVLEMESDHAVESYVQYLKDTVYALRLRRRGPYLERHDNYDQMPIYTIPSHNSFESLEKFAKYIDQQIHLNFEDGYGAIITSPKASPRKFVSLTVPHIFADGRYFTFLVDHFLNDNGHNTLRGLPTFPIQKEDIYKEYYNKAPNNVKDENHNEKLTRFQSNDRSHLKSECEFCEFVTLRLKAEELKNKVIIKDNKISVSNFTEMLYMSNYFAICAHEKKLLDSFGIINIVDLKKFSKKPLTFANCFEISAIAPFTDHITCDMKIIDVGKNLRKSINEKLINLEQFSNIPSMEFNQKMPPLKGIATEFTNVGEVHIKKPVIDLWMSISTKCLDRELVSNMGFSVIRDDFDRYEKEEKLNRSMNDLVLRYRYSPKKLSLNESKKMAKSIEYFLKNILLDEKIEKVYDEIKRFYNSL